MLDQTSLQVTGTRRLDSRVDKTFTTSHAVEEVLLRADACQETAADESTGSRGSLEGAEGGQRLAADHERNTSTFESLLTEQTRDLRDVDGRTLGTGAGHHLHVVLGELPVQAAGQARLDDLGRESVGRVHHLTVKDGELVVVTQYLLETDAQIPVGVRVVLVLALETDGLHATPLPSPLAALSALRLTSSPSLLSSRSSIRHENAFDWRNLVKRRERTLRSLPAVSDP